AQAKSSYQISLADGAWIALHLPCGEQHGTINRGLEKLSLESVLRERRSTLHRCTRSRTSGCLVDCFAGQHSLSRCRTNWRGSGNAEGDPGPSAVRALHHKDDAGVGERPIEALLLSIFLIGRPCARLRRRNEDACNKFAWLDNGF